MSIGERIRAARERRKMTQVQLAAAVGVSDTAVVLWESKVNKREITRKNLQKVAEVLGVQVSELLGEEERYTLTVRPTTAMISVTSAEKTLLDLFRGFPESLQLLQLAQFVECAKLRKVRQFTGRETSNGLPEPASEDSQAG